MSIKFTKSKFGVELSDLNAYITKFSFKRHWNVKKWVWVNVIVAEVTTYTDKTKSEVVEVEHYKLDDQTTGFEKNVVDKMLKLLYTKFMNRFPGGVEDTSPEPQNPAS